MNRQSASVSLTARRFCNLRWAAPPTALSPTVKVNSNRVGKYTSEARFA